MSRCGVPPYEEMKRKRWIKVVVLVSLIFMFNVQIKEVLFFMFGHPNFVTNFPLEDLDLCHQQLHLVGRQPVDESEITLDYLEKMYADKGSPGGHFRPQTCQRGLGRTAIIIPYRDRKKHLLQYLNNVLPKLLRQEIDFTIFVIEQKNGSSFNRGLMRNVGFMEAMKAAPFECVIFNDVDTVIEDDRNIFYCKPDIVRHLVSGLSRNYYSLPYYTLVGGIIGFTAEQFQRINGYSNLFFIWGAEDDDLYRRIITEGYFIERAPRHIAVVTTLKHVADPVVKARLTIYNSINGYHKTDGLNTLEYELLDTKQLPLFTWVYVDINEQAIMKNFF